MNTPTEADLADNAPLVKIDNVSFQYTNGHSAVSEISLALPAGSITSLIGPSGCGKSTLLNLVAGLSVPSSGRVERGRSVGQQDVSLVFQDPTLMPWSDVFDNVWLPLRFRGQTRREARSAIEQALDLVHLSDSSALRPHQLSGGMRMRVSIARALVTKPKLLLMDEPFAALDETTRFALNDEVLDLANREGLTVLFVTHSAYEAVYISDMIAIMSGAPGRILETVGIEASEGRGNSFRNSDKYLNQTARVAHSVRQAARYC